MYLSEDSLEVIGSIIGAHQEDLSATVAHAMEVRMQLTEAELAASDAEVAVKTAQENLKQANERVRHLKSAEQHAERKVETVANGIAVNVATNMGLDSVTSTLFALIYNDRALAWDESSDAHQKAAHRGRAAMSAIIERLQPGEPVLYFGNRGVTAAVANERSIAVTGHSVEGRNRGTWLSGGSIDAVMPNAITAEATTQGLVRVMTDDMKTTLISNQHKHGLDNLEKAATNEEWWVVGAEGIKAIIAQLDHPAQLLAVTALKAADVEIPLAVDADVKKKTEDTLIALMAFLAAGTSQETVNIPIHTRTGTAQITKDSPLTQLANVVDAKSILYTSQAVGISKEALRERVVQALQSRLGEDNTPLSQVAKDARSLANLDDLLALIF